MLTNNNGSLYMDFVSPYIRTVQNNRFDICRAVFVRVLVSQNFVLHVTYVRDCVLCGVDNVLVVYV